MKNLYLILVVCICVASCQPKVKNDTNIQISGIENVRDGVFIHISHGAEDAHRVSMGLSMASIMSEDKDVLVYFDIDGIEVVKKNANDITMETFASTKETLKELLEKNVPIYACPGCMKARGVIEDDLIEGIKVAEKDAFFNFTKGRIITLDY